MIRIPGQPLILVVDDEPVQVAVAAETLQAAGCRTIEATSGAEGFRLAADLAPDLILLDVLMPDIDGYAACTALRRAERTADIPIVIATALDEPAAIDRAFEVGATDFVVKPVDWALFLYRIRFLLRAGKLEAELRDAQSAAEAASGAKSAFLQKMSHELRSPLTSIVGFSDAINRRIFGPLNVPRYVDYVQDIHDSATRMQHILQRMVDLEEISGTDVRLSEKSLPPDVLIEAVVRNYADSARTAGVSIRTEHDPAVQQIVVDPVKMGRILANLVSNALNFTAQGGGIRISTKLAIDGSLRIAIVDTGIGMTQDEAERALIAASPSSDPLMRSRRGTGLGLPMASALARQHGGRLTLHSAPGKGTRAELVLPKQRVTVRREPVSGAARPADSPSGSIRKPDSPSGSIRKADAPSGSIRKTDAPSGSIRRADAASRSIRRTDGYSGPSHRVDVPPGPPHPAAALARREAAE